MVAMNKGSYLLILELEDTVVYTAGNRWELSAGYYVYVGSAMGTLTGRLKRHLESKDTTRWHVDHLKPENHIVAAILVPSGQRIEERLSNCLSSIAEAVKGFGCSDCSTQSNLYRVDRNVLQKVLMQILDMRREDS